MLEYFYPLTKVGTIILFLTGCALVTGWQYYSFRRYGPKDPPMRIRLIEGFGYIAEVHRDEWGGWQAISRSGMDHFSTDLVLSTPRIYAHGTEEEAGEAINTFYDVYIRPGKVIWTNKGVQPQDRPS